MNDLEFGKSGSACSSPELNEFVTEYCFGEASETERRLFEAHLLDCDFCWQEVHRLSAAVQVLRDDKQLLQTFSPADVGGLLGLSSKLGFVFGGHNIQAWIACSLYAACYAVGLLTEVSYAFDRLGHKALIIAPFVFIWILGTSLLGLWTDWHLVLKGKKRGLAYSAAIYVIAAVFLYIAVCQFLPNTPITQMIHIQAYTAQAAYLKGIRYALAFAGIFLLAPFHFVLVMQRELKAGRSRLSLALLSRQQWAVAPQGSFFLGVRTLWILLLVTLLISIPMGSHMFDDLKTGPLMNMFIQLMQLHSLLFFGMGLECLAWYTRALNELKRECLIVERCEQ